MGYIIKIKPLSLNKAYRGRRFTTNDLRSYQKEVTYQLPKLEIPKGKLSVKYIFGCSSKGSDGDNLIKAFQDCLAEHYGFNDNKIYKWEVEKRDVKKGEEFIEFNIKSYD
jgi:Holliday junction resolvase RusA-like endonuclease